MTTENYKSVTKQSYNEHAKDFAAFSKTFRGKLEVWIEEFTQKLKKGDQVLDLGCGSGRDAGYFIKHGLSVTGVDNSSGLIEIAKSKVPEAAFFIMDFESLAMPSEGFSGVWANASLVHAPKENILPVLKQLYQVLKPGGVFYSTWRVGSVEKFTTEKRGKAEFKRFYAYYTLDELVDLIQKAEFIDVSYDLDEIETGKWVLVKAQKKSE